MSLKGLSGGYRAGFTLERCSQSAAFAIKPVSLDAATVWSVADGVPGCAPLPSSNLVPFERWWHARGREHRRGELGVSLTGGYASDLAWADRQLNDQ